MFNGAGRGLPACYPNSEPASRIQKIAEGLPLCFDNTAITPALNGNGLAPPGEGRSMMRAAIHGAGLRNCLPNNVDILDSCFEVEELLDVYWRDHCLSC